MSMSLDQLNQSLGELKGIVKANHLETREQLMRLQADVRGLQNLHQRLKGAAALISLLVGAFFHAIVELLKGR
jgi:hypothetical protein